MTRTAVFAVATLHVLRFELAGEQEGRMKVRVRIWKHLQIELYLDKSGYKESRVSS